MAHSQLLQGRPKVDLALNSSALKHIEGQKLQIWVRNPVQIRQQPLDAISICWPTMN